MSLYHTLSLLFMYVTIGARVLPYKAVSLKGPYYLFTLLIPLYQSFLGKHFLFCCPWVLWVVFVLVCFFVCFIISSSNIKSVALLEFPCVKK